MDRIPGQVVRMTQRCGSGGLNKQIFRLWVEMQASIWTMYSKYVMNVTDEKFGSSEGATLDL